MPKKGTDLCGGIAVIGTFVFLATWLVALATWIVRGELTEEAVSLVMYMTVMQCACYAAYCCGTAYGNGRRRPQRREGKGEVDEP